MSCSSTPLSRLHSSPSTPYLTPATSFESDFSGHPPTTPITLSRATTQSPIYPEFNSNKKKFNFTKFLALIPKHIIHPNDEASEISIVTIPTYLLKKNIKAMTDEEISQELADFSHHHSTGRFIHEPNPPKSFGVAKPWTISQRTQRLGHNPAVTINHLAGRGGMAFPNRFKMLKLPYWLRAYLVNYLMVGICRGREVVPYKYRCKDRMRVGRRKPMVDLLVALCGKGDEEIVETREMVRWFL